MKLKRFLSSNYMTASVLILGIVFLSLGIWKEEYTIVFEKAINICLECVGIG